MKFGIRFKKTKKTGFDYERFEMGLLAVVEEYAKLQLLKKDDFYIMSIEYFPEFTTFVAIRANTYSHLKEKAGESEKDYTYYKFCEEEWELCECLEEISKDLQAEYEEMEAKYDDEKFAELQTEHVVQIIAACKSVMNKFKETDTYKSFSKLYLNVYIREYFTKEETIQMFCELNGEDTMEEYSDWL